MKLWTEQEDEIIRRNYPTFGSDVKRWDSSLHRTKRAIQRRAGIIGAQLEVNYDITSVQFGKLTAIKRVGTDKHRNSLWLCVCECGNKIVVPAYSLRNGHTKSCGCTTINYLKTVKPAITHGGARVGEAKERLYRVWCGMKERCYNPHNKNYKNYGGRGITVCDEWQASYESFRNWAMSHGYDPNAPLGKCTIDRINNDGNYEPTNCRWVDMKVQRKNQRRP